VGERVNPLTGDLDLVLQTAQGLWRDLAGARVFVSGGTGFFGRWMLESLLHANRELGLAAEAVALSRRPDEFARRAPEIAGDPAVTLLEGDIRDFTFPDGPFSHVLHMATETNTSLRDPHPSTYFDVSVDGTRRVLEFARSSGVRGFLLASSGAVYGPQPQDCERISEDAAIAPPPEDVAAAYGHGKRASEFLCCAAHADTGLEAKIARCFAFVGPHLPLDSGFAIGNFIGDALRGGTIRISGDGTPIRSYLYAADLAIWLWTILLRGAAARPYNVGSEHGVCIADLAHTVARVVADGRVDVDIARESAPGAMPQRYVPDTARATRELGLGTSVTLEEAIRRTAEWHRRALTDGTVSSR
jgi:nucleoside-diphosphate-sugar epimerase